MVGTRKDSSFSDCIWNMLIGKLDFLIFFIVLKTLPNVGFVGSLAGHYTLQIPTDSIIVLEQYLKYSLMEGSRHRS